MKMYFNRFTQRAKTAIDLGVESAKSFGHKIVGDVYKRQVKTPPFHGGNRGSIPL